MPKRTSAGGLRLWLWLVGGIVVTAVGCGNTSTVLLRDVERTPSAYARRVITIAGCYHNGPESTLLQPCADPKPGEVAGVVFRSQLQDAAKHVPGYDAGLVKYEQPSSKEEAIARELSQLPNGAFAEVQLRGEFQVSPGPAYGTPPGYRYQVVVDRVLSASPTAKANP
jgi:hypothetical protein